MMRILAAAFGLVAMAGLAFQAPVAQAAPPRVQGQNCSALAASIGPGKTWRTSFHGERRDMFDFYLPYSAAPCFTSQQACKAWLYWAQSDYPHRNTFTPCRRLG
jgi:hypothetical protein